MFSEKKNQLHLDLQWAFSILEVPTDAETHGFN